MGREGWIFGNRCENERLTGYVERSNELRDFTSVHDERARNDGRTLTSTVERKASRENGSPLEETVKPAIPMPPACTTPPVTLFENILSASMMAASMSSSEVTLHSINIAFGASSFAIRSPASTLRSRMAT